MVVYLVSMETNEVINTYTTVINFGYNWVEFDNNGRCKLYCDGENEFFTDTKPEEVIVDEPTGI